MEVGEGKNKKKNADQNNNSKGNPSIEEAAAAAVSQNNGRNAAPAEARANSELPNANVNNSCYTYNPQLFFAVNFYLAIPYFFYGIFPSFHVNSFHLYLLISFFLFGLLRHAALISCQPFLSHILYGVFYNYLLVLCKFPGPISGSTGFFPYGNL
jgi:hypothetical protein